jgi:hypothetical protein
VVGAIRLDSMLVRNDFPKLPEKVNKKRGRVRKNLPNFNEFLSAIHTV